MKKILFPALMILFVIGGAVGADFLKTSGDATAAEETHAPKKKVAKKAKKEDGHGKDKKTKDKKSKDKKKSKGHGKDKGGHGKDSGSSSDVSYLKFKRQFVVPVMTHGKIDALVIMNLSLEMNSDAPGNAYSLEPKFRDAITRELLALSNEGVFGANLTSTESYEDVRSTLLSATKAILPDGIQNILILDIARQDQ
ncbi:hypothetical protein N9W89_08405 [Hellea sp.]|nr:hypothetical protein [Hellea sp.]